MPRHEQPRKGALKVERLCPPVVRRNQGGYNACPEWRRVCPTCWLIGGANFPGAYSPGFSFRRGALPPGGCFGNRGGGDPPDFCFAVRPPPPARPPLLEPTPALRPPPSRRWS